MKKTLEVFLTALCLQVELMSSPPPAVGRFTNFLLNTLNVLNRPIKTRKQLVGRASWKHAPPTQGLAVNHDVKHQNDLNTFGEHLFHVFF